MRFRLPGLMLVLGVVALLTPGTAAAPTDLIPREMLFAPPALTDLTISPDGARLAYLAPLEGVTAIWVRDVDDPASARPILTGPTPVETYAWAANSAQLIYGEAPDARGHQSLRAIDVDTATVTDLTPHAGVTAQLLAVDRAFPDEILVTMNLRDNDNPDVHRVNTRTGDSQVTFANTGAYTELYADHDFVIRVVGRRTRTGGRVIYVRDRADLPWYELVSWRSDEADAARPLGFARDAARFFLIDAREHDTAQLYVYETPDGREPRYRHLWGDPDADISTLIMDPARGLPQAVAVTAPRLTWSALDRRFEADWAFLQSQGNDGDDLELLSRDHADQHWIVARSRDDRPRELWLYDRARRRLSEIRAAHPNPAATPLARKTPVTIAARDGLALTAYLTTPVGEPARSLPMVLLVHDGPWARDTASYDPRHQWLANRGYAVLSVNYRGSTGFGKSFLSAGNREWSARMHDDLIDSVNWAVDEGIAHPDRVAIMGEGYGGYAALVGLSHTPGFFAAAVALNGPADIRTWLAAPPEPRPDVRGSLDTRVGRMTEVAFLEGISPISRAAAIDRPLLLVSGGHDRGVSSKDYLRIVGAMQSRGLPVSWFTFPDEGRALERPANAMAFYAITEAFLSQHLGGRFEPADAELDRSTAEPRAGAALIPGLTRLLQADRGN